MNTKQMAEEYREKLVAYRRHLHRNPEVSFEERNTAAWVRQRLGELGIPLMEGVRGNSTVGVLKGEGSGPVLLFRADMDALPIQEENDLEFRSAVAGVMHACGHDAHTATLMCLADFLANHRELVKGTVKFVFQQAEEKAPGGGSMIVEDGVLEDVDYAFAWHCAPEVLVGTVVAAPGPRTASCDSFEIQIRGKSSHAGFPSNGIDVVSTGALVVSALNQLLPWTVAPLDSATLVISRMEAGKHQLYNVIPESMAIEGNIRSLSNQTARILKQRIKEVTRHICAAKNCTCEISWIPGYPAMVNHEAVTKRVEQALVQAGIHAVTGDPVMAAEDFAYYLKEKPGTYFNIGSSNPEKPETMYPPHNPHFCIDESVMVWALETLLTVYGEMTR